MKCEVNESKKQPAYQQAAKSNESAQKGCEGWGSAFESMSRHWEDCREKFIGRFVSFFLG